MLPIARKSQDGPSSFGQHCGQSNGFDALPEPQALVCSEASVAPYSLPAEAFAFRPTPDALVVNYKKGDRERMIHCNVELNKQEQEKLRELQQLARAKGAAFFPSVATMATRFLNRARMDLGRALDLMQATQAWRADYFKDGPITDESVMEDMSHGIVYFTGRDRALRPALVVRGNRIPQKWYKEKSVDKLIRILVFCVEYMLRFMLVPGKVENLSVIVDLQGLSLSQVPLSALNEVYKVMSHHYIGRVYRFYVCNMPTALRMVSGMVLSLLTDRQRQKLVTVDDLKRLGQEFAPHQLETDLGGSRPKIARFLPFPLPPGPFDPSAKGPDSSAVPRVHEVLTPAGATGRLWDSTRSRTQNLTLEFAPRAKEILGRCNLPFELLPGADTEATSDEEPQQKPSARSQCTPPSRADASTDAETVRAADDVASSGWQEEEAWEVLDEESPKLRGTSETTGGWGGFCVGPLWCQCGGQ